MAPWIGAEDLDAEVGHLEYVLEQHADEQSGPRKRLGDGHSAKEGAGVERHKNIHPGEGLQEGAAAARPTRQA